MSLSTRQQGRIEATFEAIRTVPSLSISRPHQSRATATELMGILMTKPVTLTSRFVDAVVTAALAFSLVVHAQVLILPPHFV